MEETGVKENDKAKPHIAMSVGAVHQWLCEAANDAEEQEFDRETVLWLIAQLLNFERRAIEFETKLPPLAPKG